MTDDIKNLATWYPFIPTGTLPQELTHIKDVKIVYTFNATNCSAQTSNAVCFSAVMLSIQSGSATFKITCPQYSVIDTVTVPVYNIANNVYPTTESYVLVDTSVTKTGEFLLSADCLIFRQTAPKLSLMCRDGLDAETEGGTTSTYAAGTTLNFIDGHNVSVSFSEDSLVWSAGTGNGLGVYTTSPFVDIEDLDISASVGLKSINGFTDKVSVEGADSVTITVVKIAGSTTQDPTIKVTINPNPLPEEEEEDE